MQNIDYSALYEQNADFKRYVDKAPYQRCRSITALSGADGWDAVQGAGRKY